MDENNVSSGEIKQKSVKGVVVLTFRTFFLQALTLASQLFLFAYLGAEEFGVFAMVLAVVNFLTYFSDIGLAAALIQKKDTPSLSDYRTTFTVQQVLVLSLVGIAFMLRDQIQSYYRLDQSGMHLLYALLISFILSSLKSIPSVILERKLEFTKLILPQIIEQVVYNVGLVALAFYGFGIYSFVYTVLLRSIIGLVLMYIIQPWKIGFDLSIPSIKDLFKFGLPYQLNTFLATVKDDGVIIFLGGVLGAGQIGILTFAQKIARYPLTFFMDSVTKVTFPAFSRLQSDMLEIKKSLEKSIFFICLLVFPSLAGLVFLMPYIISYVPRYAKWEPALVPLFYISISYALAAATTQLTNFLNATGRIKITFYLMVMWTVFTWVSVPYLARQQGVNGAALGYAIVGMSSLVVFYIVKKYVDFSIFNSILKPLLGTFVMIVSLFLSKFFVEKYIDLRIFIYMLVGFGSYVVSMASIIGMSLLEDVKRSIKTITEK